MLWVDVAAGGVAELSRHLVPLGAFPFGLDDGEDLAVAAAPRLIGRETASRRVLLAEHSEPSVVVPRVLLPGEGLLRGLVGSQRRLGVRRSSKGGFVGSRDRGGLVAMVVVARGSNRNTAAAAKVGRMRQPVTGATVIAGGPLGGSRSCSGGNVGGLNGVVCCAISASNSTWISVRHVVGGTILIETLDELVHLVGLLQGQFGERHQSEVRKRALSVLG
ncbi:uncharacterized protein PG998_006885 [Apiospora kogelbergensis]|uniref:uncharacterized protein n=1 Tax=Apiospora kogelbergensis TaxID=1337665 RepID=UPI0031302221